MREAYPHAKWYDVTDGRTAPYYDMGWRNWCSGQPDDSDNSGNGAGIFAGWSNQLSSSNYCWDDASTSDSLSYVCEKDKRKGSISHCQLT